HGVSEFYLSINYKSKIIKSYFDELNPQYEVAFVYEDKPLGTAGSLSKLKDKITGNFFVTNCDVIARTDYAELLEVHDNAKNDITIVASLKNYRIPYGICEISNGGELKEIREKPEYNFLVNTGVYAVRSHVIDLVPDNSFFHLTDLIEAVKASGGKVGVYPISDHAWLDTGEWGEYRSAVAQLTADRRRSRR
ncbi:MAG: sugar phosphate nucleotidyltransferase, partial [Gammaproteobacteria bacterium]|nr:sugar phosphate nucleotidyltransferase [Gammaproteobacteria bacterium]